MKRLLYIFSAMLLTSVSATAQDEPGERSERVEALKIGFITEKLSLTTKEASAFWPVYNEFSDQVKSIRAKQRENAKAFSARVNPTDAESDKFITDQLAFKQSELDLTRRYSQEFRKVLPVQKVARLLTLEQAFKQQLLQRLKDRRR